MDQHTTVIESFLTDVLPDELLLRVLLFTEFSHAAYVVCRKWREIMTQETFLRQACLERWGNDVIINQYEKANEKERQLLLKEYFIPLTKDGQADWKRYYSMRSNYALALQYFSPFKRAELRKDRVKNAVKFITSSPVQMRYDQCLIITSLLCDIGRMCLDQSVDYQSYFDVSTMRLFPDRDRVDNYWRSMAMTDDKTKVQICKAVLGYYYHAVAKCADDRYSPKSALVEQIVGFFLYSMAFIGKKYQHITSIKNVMSYYLFKKESTQDEFMTWLKDVYLPTCSTDLAFACIINLYRQLLRNKANPADFRMDTSVRMLFEIICEDKDQLRVPSHLAVVMDFVLDPEANVKIDTKFFTTLAELGAPFESEYMARCTDKFFTVPMTPYDTIACANAMNYLEFALLKHYPAEAQRVVIDMIEQCKPVLFWILGDAFNLVRQSLGDRWTEFRFRVVDMMLELYPLEVRTMTVKVDENSLLTGVTSDPMQFTMNTLPCIALDTVQVKCLNLLMTLPKLYPDATQRQILNVALSQLNIAVNKTELQNKILKMPYMQQVNEDTQPYYEVLTLSANLTKTDTLLDDVATMVMDKFLSFDKST